MLTSILSPEESIMTCLDTHHGLLVPQPRPARVVTVLGNAWRALFVFASRTSSVAARAGDRNALERDALAGLGEHMLKDVGASSWLVANASARGRDEFERRFESGLF